MPPVPAPRRVHSPTAKAQEAGMPRASAWAAGADEALAQLRHGGRVLSRFQRVLNLETSQGRLLALHGPALAPTPFSLVLEEAAELAWPAVGAAAWRVGETLAVGALRIDLSSAAPLVEEPTPQPVPGWQERASPLLEPFAAASAFGAWWRAAAPSKDALATVLQQRARRVTDELAAALAACPIDLARAQAPAGRLLGLGLGGTPSGDDFLVGFVGAWQRLGPDPAAGQVLAAELAAGAPTRTTRLAAVLRPIALGDEIGLAAAADRLARYGATSGRDTLAGVYAYLLARPGAPG